MSSAKDVKILLYKKIREFTNGETGEKFNKEVFDGYVTYKDVPVLRAKGARMEDKSFVNKETKQPFTIKKMYLSFYNGEDLEDDLRQDGTAYLRLDDKINRSKGNEFTAVTTDSLWFGADDKRNTKGFVLGNLHLPLNGIIESYETEDQWGDKANRLVLTADNKYSMNIITKDMLSEDKIGYTAQTDDELFTDEELQGLAKQFRFFERFKAAFDGKSSSPDISEKVIPASF